MIIIGVVLIIFRIVIYINAKTIINVYPRLTKCTYTFIHINFILFQFLLSFIFQNIFLLLNYVNEHFLVYLFISKLIQIRLCQIIVIFIWIKFFSKIYFDNFGKPAIVLLFIFNTFKVYLTLFVRTVNSKLNHMLKIYFITSSNIRISKFIWILRFLIIMMWHCNYQTLNARIFFIILVYPFRLICCWIISNSWFFPWITRFVVADRLT